MKRTTVVSLLMMLAVASADAQQQVINYFYASGDVCLPVTVKHSRGSFSFSSNGYQISGPIDYVEAWDCQGRKILDTTPDEWSSSSDKSKPIVRKYIFKTLYPQSSTQNDGYYEGESNYSSSYQSDNLGNWDRMMNNVKKGTSIYDPAYPNLTLQAGVSNVYGEYLRAKACLGGRTCYVLYGGVGHDWFFNPKNPDFMGEDAKKVAWHVGTGVCGGDLNGETKAGEFAFLIDYAKTALVENGSLNVMLQGSWYYCNDGHFGSYAGIGCSMGNFKGDKPKFHFIFEVGFAYRIF